MISIKVLLTLLAVHSCFNLSRGQITGPGSKDATEEERRAFFKSQVSVETLRRWEPTDDWLKHPYYMNLIELPPRQFKFQGSGTILTSRWVLTAAHLFPTFEKPAAVKNQQQTVKIRSTVQRVRVVVGQLAKEPAEGNTREVERVVLHGNFVLQQSKGDIALLQLSADLNFQPVRRLLQPKLFDKTNLPVEFESLGLGCKMSGWGWRDEGRESETLRWANTTVVRHTQTTWNRINNHDTDLFPVGITNQQPVNQRAAPGPGDSGGGLLCQRGAKTYVFGVAHGAVKKSKNEDYPLEQLGTADLPTLYTSVYQNLDWINKWMRIYTSEPNRGQLVIVVS